MENQSQKITDNSPETPTNPFVEILVENPSWMKRGNCYGEPTAIFFPTKGKWINKVVEEYCDMCVVKQSCLQYALDNNTKGIWGGTSELERRLLKKVCSV